MPALQLKFEYTHYSGVGIPNERYIYDAKFTYDAQEIHI